MIRSDMLTICETRTYGSYEKARKRKLKLKEEGWRVKIRKAPDGSYQIWKKHIDLIDVQQGHGNGRRAGAGCPALGEKNVK